MSSTTVNRFRILTLCSLVAVYALITIGSGVRASGSGMGCPDWPTCFGRIIPPVAESQLPKNYRLQYADRGYANAPFNAAKTWTEFGNRLAGVTTGLCILLSFCYSLFRVRKKKLVVVSAAVLATTVFQGWIGSVLVASNLHPLIVSSHMLIALVIVVGLHSQYELSLPAIRFGNHAFFGLIVLAVLCLVQIGFGLHVRQQIDSAVVLFSDDRSQWIPSLDGVFVIHWITGISLAMAVIVYMLFMRNNVVRAALYPLQYFWLAAVLLSLASGGIMAFFDVPGLFQPLHLLGASMQFGFLYHMIVRVKRGQSPLAKKQ